MGTDLDHRKTCLVIHGCGRATDSQSNPQRALDVHRTYEDVIEPTVTSAGLECIRADRIIHSTIDTPMYERLLEADLVIADLSTSDANIIYELGIRRALRPHGTIVIADEDVSFPPDLAHVQVLRYEHPGTEIGLRDVKRMRDLLQRAIAQRLATSEPAQGTGDGEGFAAMVTAVGQAKTQGDWQTVVGLLRRLETLRPNDPYVIQQLALATYKAKAPDTTSALCQARSIVARLDPEASPDAETVTLAAAIHKRLWDHRRDLQDLDAAIRLYSRGHALKRDYHNCITSAFMFDTRASLTEGEESIADRVMARQLRQQAIALCDGLLAEQKEALSNDERLWIQATKIEALSALGRADEAASLKASLTGAEGWMLAVLESQLEAVARLGPLSES